MLNKLMCFLAGHVWVFIQHKSWSAGYYDEEHWSEWKCSRCGKEKTEDEN